MADLNLITLGEAMLADALHVHRRAIGAIFVAQDVAAGVITIDGRMQARDGQVFQENVALAAAPNAQAIFAQFIRAARLFALADDDVGHALILLHAAPALLLRRAPPLLLRRRAAPPWLLLLRRAAPPWLLRGWSAPARLLWWRAAPARLLRRSTPARLLWWRTTPTLILLWRRTPALILLWSAPALLLWRIWLRGRTLAWGLRRGTTPARLVLLRRSAPAWSLLRRGTTPTLILLRGSTPALLRPLHRLARRATIAALLRSLHRLAPALLLRRIGARGRALLLAPARRLRIPPALPLARLLTRILVVAPAAAAPIIPSLGIGTRGGSLAHHVGPCTANRAAEISGAVHRIIVAHAAARLGRAPVAIVGIAPIAHRPKTSCGAFVHFIG